MSADLCIVLDHLIAMERPLSERDASALVRCLDGSNAETVGGARELCRRKPTNMIRRARTMACESSWVLRCAMTCLSMSGVTGCLTFDGRRMSMETALRANVTL